MTLLEVQELSCEYQVRGPFGGRSAFLRAVDNVTFSLDEGQILGLVGETGSGKSTLGKVLAGIKRPSHGSVTMMGTAILSNAVKSSVRSAIQYIHQDPSASLNPRWTFRRSLHEPLIIHTRLDNAARERKIKDVVASLELPFDLLDRHPAEASGGQQRRMAIARILLLKPKIIIFDEPTSGLDVFVQASVLTLLRNLQRQRGLTYIFISHDVGVVSSFCDRVAVMYRGRIVESGPTRHVFTKPEHPYTKNLVGTALHIGGKRRTDGN